MTLLALLTYPWIMMVMTYTAVIPRALADDLSLWARELESRTQKVAAMVAPMATSHASNAAVPGRHGSSDIP